MINKIVRITESCYRLFISDNGIKFSSEGIFTKDVIKSVYNLTENDFNKLVTYEKNN